MSARIVILALLVLSLTANAAIVLRLWRAPKLASAAAPTVTGNTGATAPGRTVELLASAASGSAPARADTTDAVAERPLWAQFETRDPAELAARLRAAGFSNAAAKAAVRLLMVDLAAEARARAMANEPLEPFWKTASPEARWNRSSFLQHRERERQIQAMFPDDDMQTWQQRARFGPLPPEKLAQLSLLDRDYNDMRRDIQMRTYAGPRMPWTADELRLLEEERQRDLAALLTPAELELYELRGSQTAQTMQRQLGPFNASEQEYREIFRLRSAFDRQFSTIGPTTAEEAMARRQAQQATDAAIKSALGEQRYAEYTRSLDNGFQAAYAVAQQRGLGGAAALAAYEIQQDSERRANEIRSDRSRSPEQHSAEVSAMLTEASTKLRGVLTDEGWDRYRERAMWLRNLERQAGLPGR